MQVPIPQYKPIQEVIKNYNPRLILFSCPKEYGVDVKAQYEGNIHPSLYSYPARGAAFIAPQYGMANSLLILPETPAMKEMFKAFKAVCSFYRIPEPEAIWGPDPVEPGERFGIFDKAVATHPEIIKQIMTVTPNRGTRYALISHAYTPETEQV